MDASLRLRISTTTGSAGPVLSLAGDLDPLSCPAFEAAIEAILPGAPHQVTVDLSAVEFIDSAGLRCLVTARDALARTDGVMVLRSASRATRRLLDITSLTSLFLFDPPDPAPEAH